MSQAKTFNQALLPLRWPAGRSGKRERGRQGVSSWGGERAKLAEIRCWYGLHMWWAGVWMVYYLVCPDYTDKSQPTKLEALWV